jgi:hypothetical protein
MSNKFLILEFRNAGLFDNHIKSKDRIFDMGVSRPRSAEPQFEEPITVHQVSNMLHVLFGERPKPSRRVTVYNINDYIFDKAMNSYLKIESYKDIKGRYFKENIHLNKAVGNAWATQSYMNWERVRRLLGPELFSLFTTTINDVYGIDCELITFNDVRKLILENTNKKIDEMFEILNSNKKKPLWATIYGINNEPVTINANIRTQLTGLNGLDKVAKLDGSILVPINDEDIIKLGNNKGHATLLDGGLVIIKGIKSANTINVDGYQILSDISLKEKI